MKDSKNQDELLGELVQSDSLLVDQFSTFSCVHKDAKDIKKVHESAKALQAEFDEFKKLGQQIDKQLDDLLHMLRARLPDQQLMKDAPGFFQRHDNWTAPTSSTPQFLDQPRTQEDFE